MLRTLRAHLRHNLVAYLALFVALGGTSYAAIKLPAKSVGTKQLKNRAVTPKKLHRSTIARFRGQTGPQGTQGIQGLQGEQGVQGPPGSARAYGRVHGTSIGNPATVTRSKGVVRVDNPVGGTFCITVDPSIDISQTGVVVTPDIVNGATSFAGGTQPQSIAEWRSDGFGCPGGTLMVQTGRQSDTSGNSTNVPENEAFFFVVP